MLQRAHFEVGETAVTVIAEERFIPIARSSIFRSREIIQRFIHQDPFFRNTLEPYDPPQDAPLLIGRMCQASAKAGVGPMATVAGAVASEAVEAMVRAGARTAVVDNGGDIALRLSEEVRVGIYSGNSLPGIGFRCTPCDAQFGICSSSRTVGPSISFGMADLATVISDDVLLADACATALGNMVEDDSEATLTQALDRICNIAGVEGALVMVGKMVAMRGKLPEIISMRVGADRASRIELVP